MRKEFGANKVFIVGFGFYSGSFIAAEKWGQPYQKMEVPGAAPRTFEYMLHNDSPVNKIILSKDIRNNPLLKSWVGNRAIGVENNPDQLGSFAGSLIPQRYDAFIYIDRAVAIHPYTRWRKSKGVLLKKTYQPVILSTYDLLTFQFINLPTYQTINLSSSQLINLPTYQTSTQ